MDMTQAPAQTSDFRPLTDTEVDQVSGGMIPIWLVAFLIRSLSGF
jgi:hypothetical protein